MERKMYLARVVMSGIGFVVMLALVLACLIWPKRIQALALRQLGDPNKVSDSIPYVLRPLARRLKRFDYNSMAGSDYVELLRALGFLGTVIMIVALILIILRPFL
jgi:hypothetical protein